MAGEMCQCHSRQAVAAGNHDVWPGTIPSLMKAHEINRHYSAFNGYQYLAEESLKMEFKDPEGALVGDIQLYELNRLSVRDGPIAWREARFKDCA